MNGTLVSLNELVVGDRLFDIPVYQRGYAWEDRNFQDLWEDLYYLDASKKHYFGTVLLKKSSDPGTDTSESFDEIKGYDIIDGQQRLTTILILLREIISQLKAVGKEVSRIEENYFKDRGYYKLNPPDEDGKFFKGFIIGEEEHLRENTETPSQARLVAAKDFFRGKIEEERKNLQPDEFVKFLAEFKRKIDDLQIIQYLVDSDADAIRIFETVNDRGKSLSNLEKTKSFLMHISYLGLPDDSHSIEEQLGELNTYFSRIYGYFENVSGTKAMGWLSEDDIQRYHFVNYVSHDRRLVAVDELKSRIRGKFRQDKSECVKYTLNYAKDLEQAFFAVKDIAATHENKKENKLGSLLDKIFKVDRLGNISPLLIASWLKFREHPSGISEILKLLEAFTFRVYAVGGWRSDSAVGQFYGMAHNVHNGVWDCGTLTNELKNINRRYRSDEEFQGQLQSEDLYRRLSGRDIKYLLSEYEIHLIENSRECLTLSQDEILSPGYQVEHIWPQDPSKLDLQEDMAEWHSQNVDRLGNLTLTSQSWNTSMSNKPFNEKRLKYKDSSLRVQRELAALSEWNPDAIKEREDRIVEFALKRWSI